MRFVGSGATGVKYTPPPTATVDVLIRFDSYRSDYVIHCHQLEHESMGMMAAFRVV